MYFANVVLPVPVGVKNKILGCIPEPGGYRRTITAVVTMVNDTNFSNLACHPVQDLSRVVQASIIDHDDFEVFCDCFEFSSGALDDFRNRMLVVVSGKNCCDGIRQMLLAILAA